MSLSSRYGICVALPRGLTITVIATTVTMTMQQDHDVAGGTAPAFAAIAVEPLVCVRVNFLAQFLTCEL